ncbi:MAG: MBL fold metallo-hydrolase [Deltaproteobacteria bacterium]|nr:MBL fold metallo-hydrolase [Deltaproteobacteria bacterium]
MIASRVRDEVLERVGQRLGGLRLHVDEVVAGIQRVRLSSRLSRANHMEASVYLVGDVLVDAGFGHSREALLPFLERRRLAAICLTHHHEDHTGAAGALGARHGCPVYLRNPGRRHEEGLAALKPYRHLWWGEPEPYQPVELPAVIADRHHRLWPVPIPGHSATHTAFHHEASGAVFTGDLFISAGVTAVMSHENPFDSIASLRRVADLEPTWMLSGHALAVERPAALLRRKADAIEQAAGRILELHARGLPPAAIVWRLFPRGRALDLWMATLTAGEFSRGCLVRACLRHAPAARGAAARGA